jgi:hypothetical protein
MQPYILLLCVVGGEGDQEYDWQALAYGNPAGVRVKGSKLYLLLESRRHKHAYCALRQFSISRPTTKFGTSRCNSRHAFSQTVRLNLCFREAFEKTLPKSFLIAQWLPWSRIPEMIRETLRIFGTTVEENGQKV